jgi:hypothetical protein
MYSGPEPIDAFYKAREKVVREAYDAAMVAIQVERERKAKAGELASTATEHSQGLSALRFMLYNKVIIQVLCARQIDSRTGVEKGQAAAVACMDSKHDHLTKYLKLEDYVVNLGAQTFLKCEIKTRDYKSEVRFPPYEFLRDTTGPKIIDFAAMNDCILANVK